MATLFYSLVINTHADAIYIHWYEPWILILSSLVFALPNSNSSTTCFLYLWRLRWQWTYFDMTSVQNILHIKNPNPLSLAWTSAPCCSNNCTTRLRLYPAARCKGVERRPSLAWQLTFRGFSRVSRRSSAPDLAASSSSSFRWSPVNTGLVAASASSRAVLPSVLRMLASAPCCKRAEIQNTVLLCLV